MCYCQLFNDQWSLITDHCLRVYTHSTVFVVSNETKWSWEILRCSKAKSPDLVHSWINLDTHYVEIPCPRLGWVHYSRNDIMLKLILIQLRQLSIIQWSLINDHCLRSYIQITTSVILNLIGNSASYRFRIYTSISLRQA